MDKSELLDRIGEFGLNLYDAAVMDGDGIAEKRYQPCNACNNSYSVAKAFTMTAIGMLQDDGVMSVDDRVTDFFPDFKEADPGWADVSVENAITHTIGFADGFLDIDDDSPTFLTDGRERDYLSLVKRQKLGYRPGTHYAYSDTAYYLLSRIVEKASGKTVDEFLRDRLIVPMDFGSIAWSRCPMGHPMGATGLYISAKDMVKLGWLYLNGGEYKGDRIISPEWVEQVIKRGYEFNPVNGTCLYGKGGLNCQMVLFSLRRGFAAAWHGFNPNGSDRELIQWLAKV